MVYLTDKQSKIFGIGAIICFIIVMVWASFTVQSAMKQDTIYKTEIAEQYSLYTTAICDMGADTWYIDIASIKVHETELLIEDLAGITYRVPPDKCIFTDY